MGMAWDWNLTLFGGDPGTTTGPGFAEWLNDNIADQPGQGPDGMVPTSTDDGVIVWDAMGSDSRNL